MDGTLLALGFTMTYRYHACRRLMRFETTANTQPKQLEQQNNRLTAKVYYKIRRDYIHLKA